jgi:hypothetical protein
MFHEQQRTLKETCYAREYTLFVPTQLLHNWCEQRLINLGELDLSASGEIGKVLHGN